MKKNVIRKITACLLAAAMCMGLCSGFTANAQETDGSSQQTESKGQDGQTGGAEQAGNSLPEEDIKEDTDTQKSTGTDNNKPGTSETAGQKEIGTSEASGEQKQRNQQEENAEEQGLSGQEQPDGTATEQELALQSASGLSNPRIEKDSGMKAGQKVTWDCVWFGRYPQAEVVPSKDNYTAVDKSLLKNGDIIENGSLYNKLQGASGWNANNDITVDGNKYRRIKKSDATYTGTISDYYNWSDSATYHYFKYERSNGGC